MKGYYYNKLNTVQKNVYDIMSRSFDILADSFRVPLTDNKQLSDAFIHLKLDNPLLFYVVSFRYRIYPESSTAEILPEYLFDKQKIKEHRKAVDARIERLARPLQNLSPIEKEKAIHDFILENVRYDKLKKSYSHEIIGPLTQGVGVCEGIAKTVKALCDASGIECIAALGEACPEKGIKYRHMWNIVTLNGKSYHLDATFDNSLRRGEKRYDYFNLDDRRIFADHQPPVYPLPRCDDDKGFYYRSISLTKTEDVENRFAQALRKNRVHFIFHWRGGGLNKQIIQELISGCSREAEKKNKKISCSVNITQSVIQFDIGENTDIEIQQPDEEREFQETL